VNILSMLMRLQNRLERHDLAEQLILRPLEPWAQMPQTDEIHLMVGYSNSAQSQRALDLTLCMAHQTRLATSRPVTVQVVYVVEDDEVQVPVGAGSGRSALAIATDMTPAQMAMNRAAQFEKADGILWQARCLAEEWRGSLRTHLRFGDLASELRRVVASESASMLVLGCETSDHGLIRSLGRNFPCPVLGVPDWLGDSLNQV
jgi:nucleotide-binding universal stress UspA family protein